MFIYSVVTEPIPVEIPYDSWEEIPEDAWNDIDRMALDELRWEVANNDWYPLRHYRDEEEAREVLGE